MVSSGPPQFAPEESASADILVVEDPFVSNFVRAVLQKRRHKVVISEAERASELLRQGRLRPHLVITNKPEVFLQFADALPVLYIAANPDPRLASQFANCRVLRKPFRNDDLVEAVEELARDVVP
jgi:CheY-like chemotaxis protein